MSEMSEMREVSIRPINNEDDENVKYNSSPKPSAPPMPIGFKISKDLNRRFGYNFTNETDEVYWRCVEDNEKCGLYYSFPIQVVYLCICVNPEEWFNLPIENQKFYLEKAYAGYMFYLEKLNMTN